MGRIGQRKTVTVLFADLVDSTAMAEAIDAEALSELLSHYFRSMRSIIERHGGRVEKFIGDAVVGMFGVPTTHEDDALRAVRAAVEMQSAFETMNTDLDGRHGVRVATRIGINTGEVAVTTDQSGQGGGMALGHAINMAARLEQAAGPGEILMGARTFELVERTVDSQAVGPLAVKGSSVPIEAWRVDRLRETIARGWESDTQFVGRDGELAAIELAFATAASERACVVVTVVAPPGMGKSRLGAEATRGLGERAMVLVGRCLPYGEGVTYAPLIEMATSPELPADVEAVSRARQTLADTALASPEETAWVFKQLLEALAERRPVVAVVDDLHWAEPLLLDVLDYVATFSVERPILMLCLARPDLFDARPEWATPRPHAVTVRLDPLTRAETEALLASDDATAADPELRRRIVEAAGGVPLFVEQMAALSSEGEGGVPATVRALLAARVDRLQKSERTVLEAAAIQGEAFDRPTVAALAGSLDVPLGATLIGLVRREFVRPERSAQGGERFRFSHALLRDAVYEQLPRRVRSDLHERYAELLLSSGGDAEVIGHQLERAHAERVVMDSSDPATAEVGLRAGQALHDAGRRALARKEWQHARDLLERARPLLANAPERTVELLVDVLAAVGELFDWDRAAGIHREAVGLARSLGDTSTELRAELAWTSLQGRRGSANWRERSREVAERAIEHFATVGDEASLASALLHKALAMSGDTARSIELLREAQIHAERAGDERTQIEIWDELGGVMIFGPTPYPEVLDFVRREVAWARERGIAFTEADGLLGEAYAIAASGETERAREAVARVRELFAQLPGFVSQLGESDMLAASIEFEAGDLAAAEGSYRRAMDVFERGEHAPWWRAAALGLTHVLIELDRLDEANTLLDHFDQSDHAWAPRPRSSYLQARAKLAAAAGDGIGALDLARQSVDAIADSDAPQHAARAHELLGDLLAAIGDAAASRAEIELARDLYVAKGYVPGEVRLSMRTYRDKQIDGSRR